MKQADIVKVALSAVIAVATLAPSVYADSMTQQVSAPMDADTGLTPIETPVANSMTRQTVTTTNNTIPVQTLTDSRSFLFNVKNPSNDALTFSVPDLGISYPVPANSNKTFYISRESILAPSVAYMVTDASGNQLSSGALTNADYILASRESEQLASIINYNTAYTADAKPEPTYERNVSYPSSNNSPVVRGRW